MEWNGRTGQGRNQNSPFPPKKCAGDYPHHTHSTCENQMIILAGEQVRPPAGWIRSNWNDRCRDRQENLKVVAPQSVCVC